MGGYSDGYEDLDEYEDEEAEGEEYEEEEDAEPKKEVQDYLALRQRLKEQKREKLKKELGPGNTPSPGKYSIPKSKDKYGSFFGSSQPIIADRVIQESKSLLENPDFLAKAMKSKNMVNKSSCPASVSSKSQAVCQRPKVDIGLTKKIQMLRNSRDYSFLESDDAQPPERSKDPPRNVSAPISARLHQSSERNKESSSMAGRNAPSTKDGKKPTPVNGHVRPKVEGDRFPPADKHKKPVLDSMKLLSISNRTLADGGKRIPSNISSGPGRPMASKSVASQVSGGAEKRIAVPIAKSTSLAQKPAPPKLKPAVSKQQPPISKQSVGKGEHAESRKQKVLARQNAHEELRKQKVLPKQGGTLLKPKVTLPPPKSSARTISVDDRPRKRPPRPLDDDDSDAEAINMIRKMFGYNPNRYRDEDYDDRDMEANFQQIEMEEKESARIAKLEDEEELRKIEEEERRERLRKEAKKRKLPK